VFQEFLQKRSILLKKIDSFKESDRIDAFAVYTSFFTSFDFLHQNFGCFIDAPPSYFFLYLSVLSVRGRVIG
jgi:hypothetical protein